MEKDGTLESVTLKNYEYLGKVCVQSSNALKQLRLCTQGVAVYVDLPLILYTSPFLSTLVEQLKDCCISGHDEVDILVEPISPDLLHPFKSLVETGECWVKSKHDKEGLEDLIKELGMDLVVTLSMGGKGEESAQDIVISDYEELDDCVEIDGHNSSNGFEDSRTPPEETIQDPLADNSGENENEESYLPTPERMSHKRKIVCNETPFILSAVKRKCFVKLNQQNLNEENCDIVNKQFSLSENLHLSKDGVLCENKTLDKQQDFIEKYIEEHIRKNSVDISETSVTVVKHDSTNLPSKDENCDETVQCQICQRGNFIEKDLFEHLYKNHIGLQRKINKSFAEKVPTYYTLERNKKKCSCPICGNVMKAVRQKVGLHWAVDHKQIQKFYDEEINEKKRQELLKSDQGSSDKEVNQGMKEKGIETEVNDVGIKITEGKRGKPEVHNVGIKKTEGKGNLTFVETELSRRKAEVNGVGIKKTEEKGNFTFGCTLQDEQVTPLLVMRKNWQKRVQSFVSNITTANQQSTQDSMDGHEKIVQKKEELSFPTNSVSDNSQYIKITNHLEKSKPFQESTIDQKEVVEKANESKSLETYMSINTDRKESRVRVLKSLEDSMADQEKIHEMEKASFACRRNTVSNMNLDIKENSLPKEPTFLKDSTTEKGKDVIKERESSSPIPNVSNSNADKKENSLVNESLLLQDSVTGRKEVLSSKNTVSNNNADIKENNLVQEAQLFQYSMTNKETNVNKQELLLEKLPSLKNSDSLYTKKPDVCLMDTIVDNLKDMDELGTAIIMREASRHRIENSTRKLKQQLVEELWDHYLNFHSVHLKFQCKQSDRKVYLEDKSNCYTLELKSYQN